MDPPQYVPSGELLQPPGPGWPERPGMVWVDRDKVCQCSSLVCWPCWCWEVASEGLYKCHVAACVGQVVWAVACHMLGMSQLQLGCKAGFPDTLKIRHRWEPSVHDLKPSPTTCFHYNS